jgi:hypothetical protein
MSINHPEDLDAELAITMFETDVLVEYLPDDIYDHLAGNVIYDGGKEAPNLPDAMYLKLDAAADEARKVRVPMVKALSEDPTLGSDGDQRGSEENIKTKHTEFEYTDISHATTNQAYGITARDKIPYKIFEQRVPLMANYYKQYFGKMRRQASLEMQSENLLEAPHYNAPALNPNWFVPNINDSDQPQFRQNYDHFVNNVCEALGDAGTGEAAAISVRFEQRLEDWCFATKFLVPLDLPDGQQGFIRVIPLPQYTWLKHPVNARTLGPIWRDKTALPQEGVFNYPGVVGMIGRFVYIADSLYPTVTPAGGASASAGGASLTCRYRGMGNADDGSSDPRDFSSSARQIGFVYGKQALCEWMPEKFHWEWEYEWYDKFFGSGLFCSVGIKGVAYDVSVGKTYRTKQCMGMAVTPFAKPPREGY